MSFILPNHTMCVSLMLKLLREKLFCICYSVFDLTENNWKSTSSALTSSELSEPRKYIDKAKLGQNLRRWKIMWQRRDHLEKGGAKFILLGGPRILPVRPSNMSSMNMNTLKLWDLWIKIRTAKYMLNV